MSIREKFTLEERPETDVYTTSNGFVGIKQRLRGEETIVLFTVEETVKIIGYLQNCVKELKAGK